ncbi:calcium-binding protein [Vibrio splendidus]|uniref:calcium-binding protein n=1 Tax=Vibrio splendidus TaxID=29497 RepID=UPI0015E76936|nr:calcium-binding protein [Vibrio splendidus]
MNKLDRELMSLCDDAMKNPTTDNFNKVREKIEQKKETEQLRGTDAFGALGLIGELIDDFIGDMVDKGDLIQDHNTKSKMLDAAEDYLHGDKKRRKDLKELCENDGDQLSNTPLKNLVPPPPTPGSPLILDLDGDGIETTNLENGVYFDHNGDGKLERSATATSDDGFLALDLDGNGTIDYGKELFGDNTVLADGTLAKNGFEALAQYDENADGIIDANDSIYNQLKVFRDLNQDGISQANELFTLKDLDIASVKVTYTESTHVDDMGNEHRQQSQYTKSDGTSFSLTDVWFKMDKSDFIYPTLPIPEDIQQLPDINGIGSLPSLHYAMTVDESGNLKSLVEQYQLGTSSLTDNELLTEIMLAWAGVSGEYSPYYQSRIDTRKIQALEKFYGHPLDKPRGSGVQYTALFEGVFENLKGEIALRLNGIESNLFKEVKWVQEGTTGQWYGDFSSVANSLIELASLQTPEALREINQFFETVSSIDDQYSNNQKNLYSYLFDYANSDSNDLPVGFDKLIHISITDEFSVGTNADDEVTGTNANDFIAGFDGNDKVTAGSGNDNVYGGAGDDVIHGQNGNDHLYGEAGNDTITAGYYGNSTLDGGTGDDTLSVTAVTSTSSTVRNNANGASHTFIGGQGNDRLVGGLGADRYVFNRGDGHDTIRDKDWWISGSKDRIELGEGITQSDLSIRHEGDHLVLLIGGAESGDSITIESAYSSSQYHIEEVALADGTVLTAQALFELPMLGSEQADEILGTGYSEEVHGKGGDDAIHGRNGADRLYGEAGNDTITAGYYGNSTLNGGAGDDTLSVTAVTSTSSTVRNNANGASHTFIGGQGNDRLVGGLGADRYVFNRGDGHDTIRDKDWWISGSKDRIELGEGITQSDLSIRYEGDHLVLLIGGAESGDSITIESAYSSSQYHIEELVLNDGTTLVPLDIPEYSQVETGLLVQAMSSFVNTDSSLSTSAITNNFSEVLPSLVVNNQK